MGFLAAPQDHVYAHFVSALQKFLCLACSHVEVVRSGRVADSEHFGFNFLLFGAVFALAPFPFVFELAEIGNLYDRGVGGRRDLNQVKAAFLGDAQGLLDRQDADLALVVNDPNRREAYLLIYAITSLDISTIFN